ncbi:MAG: hypothetical protein ABIH20_05125, partial [Candidatus Diapherotrites archaeon]
MDADKEPSERKYTRILESKLNMGDKKKNTVGIQKNLLLNEDEAIKFRNSAQKRGTATYVMLMTGMELGCRKETLGQTLIHQITFNKNKETGKIVSFDIDGTSKTGSAHWHGVQCAEILHRYVTKEHPSRATSKFNNAPLFLTQKEKPWTSANITKEVKVVCNIAGIPKEKARPHWIFRHRRASYLFGKYTSAVATRLLNFAPGSNVGQKTYFHFTKSQGDELIDAEHGLSEKKEIKELDANPVCPLCNTKASSPNAVMCEAIFNNRECNTPIGRGLL